MLYCVKMDVVVPHDVDATKFEQLKTAEKEFSQKLQRDGRWVHLWRIAGHYANNSIFDVADHDELYALLSGLLLFPFMQMKVISLARHLSAVAKS